MNEARRRAALSLGANLGDATSAFVHAVRRLTEARETSAIAVSSIYRTSPWGRADQPDFLNMAAIIETALAPRALLALCLAIEAERGRTRRERWSPRTLDIDIVDFDGAILTDPALTLPHPHACERDFVLIPLFEIAPDLRIGSKTVRSLVAERKNLSAEQENLGVVRDEAETKRMAAALRSS